MLVKGESDENTLEDFTVSVPDIGAGSAYSVQAGAYCDVIRHQFL